MYKIMNTTNQVNIQLNICEGDFVFGLLLTSQCSPGKRVSSNFSPPPQLPHAVLGL